MKTNIMRFVPERASRAVSMTALRASKHSPRLLFVGGVVGGVTATVLACRATLKVEDVLTDHEKQMLDIKTVQHAQYSDKDRQHDKIVLYTQTVVKLTRLYAPAIIIGSVSIAALTKSHDIMTQRNAALSAAYAGLEATFGNYRERVKTELGEEREQEIYRDVRVVETTDGKSVTVSKTVGPDGGSMYARFYDESNRNYMPEPEMNIMTLRRRENYLNDRLRMKGFLLLNDVYEELGFDPSTPGSQVGWIFDPEGRLGDGVRRASYVDFGIWADSNRDRLLDFVTGTEGGIFLDFNVDGEIWRDIDKVKSLWSYADKTLRHRKGR